MMALALAIIPLRWCRLSCTYPTGVETTFYAPRLVDPVAFVLEYGIYLYPVPTSGTHP